MLCFCWLDGYPGAIRRDNDMSAPDQGWNYNESVTRAGQTVCKHTMKTNHHRVCSRLSCQRTYSRPDDWHILECHRTPQILDMGYMDNAPAIMVATTVKILIPI
jgi:hypothetical protein